MLSWIRIRHRMWWALSCRCCKGFEAMVCNAMLGLEKWLQRWSSSRSALPENSRRNQGSSQGCRRSTCRRRHGSICRKWNKTSECSIQQQHARRTAGLMSVDFYSYLDLKNDNGFNWLSSQSLTTLPSWRYRSSPRSWLKRRKRKHLGHMMGFSPSVYWASGWLTQT